MINAERIVFSNIFFSNYYYIYNVIRPKTSISMIRPINSIINYHENRASSSTQFYGLSRSLPDPASDCTATCILAFGYFLNAYLVYA